MNLKDPKDLKDFKDLKDLKDFKDLKDLKDLKDIKGALPTAEELAACTKCSLATLGRQHVVPGQGNADSPDFMFIGEAPGADEDRQGLAFVGAAGQFLTKMIAAMGYAREQVFIANICKCRPPNNRTPSPQEMLACLPYLKRQIALVRPKCIVLLGRTAMNGLFPGQRIRRCAWYEYEGIPTIATFHPSYIIRFDPVTDAVGLRAAKTEVWNTLKLALARLGKQPPTRK
ncbi:MAG: uracil-DNA glycosylase [Kiritimatiellae bacterium]|nr:uracil-DNA glycosylase [Kiritimatiellia bacterium]